MNDFTVTLNQTEINEALNSAASRVTKILYVYEQSQTNTNFCYKSYVYSVIMYISSLNTMMQNKLTSIIVNLNSLLVEEGMTKTQIRKIVLDSKNQLKAFIAKE